MQPAAAAPVPLAVVIDRYPDSEAPQIACLLKALEGKGQRFVIWTLRTPDAGQSVHQSVGAEVRPLPVSLSAQPARVLGGLVVGLRSRGFLPAALEWMRTMLRAPTPQRLRQLGQACVLNAEGGEALRCLLAIGLAEAGGVARLAAQLRGCDWGVLAMEPEIWGLPEAECADRVASALFCLAPSARTVDLLRPALPARDRVGLAAPAVDLRQFQPPADRPSARCGDSDQAPVRLVSVGRLEEASGYRDLLVALADLPRSTHWHLTHFGDGELAEKLHGFAANLHIDRHIAWRGRRDHAEVLAGLREADIYVQSPRVGPALGHRGLSHALVEAASVGLPVISTRHPTLKGFLGHQTSALIVRNGRSMALTDAIDRLARDPEERARLGMAARAAVESRHALGSVADDLARRLAPALA